MSVHIALADDPNIVEYGSFPTDREFIFVLPKRPITFTITARGFEEWHPSADPGLPNSL